jgi:hypothetical protein
MFGQFAVLVEPVEGAAGVVSTASTGLWSSWWVTRSRRRALYGFRLEIL